MTGTAVQSRRVPVTSWSHRSGTLDLTRPVIMGVLNVTPDSFSDGGLYLDRAAAVDRAAELVAQGADILDIGGESTRPGAQPVPLELELERVVPLLTELRSRFEVPLSIDTRHAAVARETVSVGADIVNDISALGDPAMAGVVAESGAGLVLMHMRGTPATMQDAAHYEDVVREVTDELAARAAYATGCAIPADRIVIDPGIGFAKTFEHNLQLLARLDTLEKIGRPVLLGVSRKAFLGVLLGGAPAPERAVATAAACVMGLIKGARIFRVHDVKLVREALVVAEAIRAAPLPSP